MSRALILGAVFVDVVVNVSRLPTTGADVTGELAAYHVGGCAYNVYGAVRAANQSADLFVPVGFGQYAERVRADFQQRGIRVNLPVTDADNGWDLALVEPNGERSFLTIDGVEQLWQAPWFDLVDLGTYDYFYLSGYELENERSAQIILDALAQRRPGTTVIFDPSPRVAELNPEVLDAVIAAGVLLHANQVEIATLVPGEAECQRQLQVLFKRTQQPVIATLGALGTAYYDQQGYHQVPCEAVNVVNTIGAGDSHCGGLLAALMTGTDLATAVKHANQAAERVVQRVGGSLIED